MNDQSFLKKELLNNRNQNTSNIVDNLLYDKNILELKQQYSEELKGYDYIDTLVWFSLLELKGSMRYINKYDRKLRYGGLLIKIINNNNKWIAMIKKLNKIHYISFNNNYIFYNNSKDHNLRDWAECFINDINNDKYNVK